MKVIRNFTIARLVCLGSRVAEVPTNAFVVPSENNPTIDCTELREFDLSLWTDKK